MLKDLSLLFEAVKISGLLECFYTSKVKNKLFFKAFLYS